MVCVQLSGGRLRAPPGFATKRRHGFAGPSVSRTYFAHPLMGPLSSHILSAKETVHVCVSVQSITWEDPCLVSLGLRPGLSVHGDHVLVFAEGLAKAEALDSTAGRISRIQES